MKIAEIRGMTDEQLEGAALNASQDLFRTRLTKSTGEVSDRNLVRKLRRDIARMNTVKTERAAIAAAGQE
jgi:large subunit ribosomal protein L29